MSNDKRFTMSTDTDLHFDMLADKSKLKLVPNYNTPIIKEDNEQSSVSEMDNNFNLDANSSEDSERLAKEKSDTPIQNHSESRNNNSFESESKEQIQNNYVNNIKSSSFDSEAKEQTSNYTSNLRGGNNSGIYENVDNKMPTSKMPTYNVQELYSNNTEVPYNLLDEQTRKVKKWKCMQKYYQLKGQVFN